jgi:conjugative transfer signal peptidase TraF
LIRIRLIIALLSASAIAALVVPAQPKPGSFVWNFTPSIPVGLYRIEAGPWRRGDLVAVDPSGELLGVLKQAGVLKSDRLLLKRVAGVRGDTVCREGDGIYLNGELVVSASAVDAAGGALPEWSACRTLTDKQVFLLGDDPRSFDGRYFGPTASDVIGPMTPVLQIDAG